MGRTQNPVRALEQECRLAEHQFSRGAAAEALPHFRRALLIDPDATKLRLRAGQCMDRLGRTAEAYQTYRDILSRGIQRCEESLQREILLAFTNLCLRFEKELEVIEILGEHQAEAERTPALHYNLGIACYKVSRFELARGHFEHLRAMHPGSSAGYVGQAILFCHFGHFDSAARVLEEALRSAPGDVQIVENLAVVHMKIGNPLAAVTVLRNALSTPRGRRNAKLLHLLGMAYLRLGNLGRAETHLLESLAAERLPEALRELGWLKVAKGDYAGSIELLKEALVINPNDIWAKVDLAVAYFKQGILAEARTLFEEARAASPTSEMNRILDDLARSLTAGQKS